MKKILIIEDEVAYQKLLQKELSVHGYDILTALDCKKGLALANQHRPDIILLDIRIAGMDGLTMLQKLRKDSYGKSVKVIILTNLEPDDLMIKKVIMGQPAYYLVKNDIMLTDLFDKIKELLL